ncbi:AAA family ATPase [Candidatus Babeliales bacterium]|nr:AAA family ATPase [Candidatus Babeliales bacterium]
MRSRLLCMVRDVVFFGAIVFSPVNFVSAFGIGEFFAKELIRSAFGTASRIASGIYIKKVLPRSEAESIAEEYLDIAKNREVPIGAMERIRNLATQLAFTDDGVKQHIIRENLDFIINFPWKKKEESKLDTTQIQAIKSDLDSFLPGMSKLSEMLFGYVLAHVASKVVPSVLGGRSMPVLCIVGPESAEKDWIASLTAQVLNRSFCRTRFPKKYYTQVFDGSADEAGIFCKRQPGYFAKLFADAGSSNCVVLIDKVDEISYETAERLAVVFDSAVAPVDEYLGVAPGVSRVLFVCGAQCMASIPHELRLRMNFVFVESITEEEKIQFAQKTLIKRSAQMAGFPAEHAVVTRLALKKMLREYAFGLGVEELARLLVRLFMEGRKVLELTGKVPVFDEKGVVDLLGPGIVKADVRGNSPADTIASLHGEEIASVNLDSFNLSRAARREAERDLEQVQNGYGMERASSRKHLEWILSLPWGKESTLPDKVDLVEAKKILDTDHFGLTEVKDRILDYLAVRERRGISSLILCLVGPPGVGKTSIASSIAHCLGRKFERAVLGGICGESAIRGWERSYVDALPGKIIKAFRSAGVANPVVLLDEIDKLGGSSQHGDPASALLEVLDGEQNNAFVDSFLGIPFDLSKAIFVVTANTLSGIPEPLIDRLEIINLHGYTIEEKIEIAKRHLMPKLNRDLNNKKDVVFDDVVIKKIIESYTMEAGVRSLDRQLKRMCEKLIRFEREGRQIDVNKESLQDFLGAPIPRRPDLTMHLEPGIVTGLAWTVHGGVIGTVQTALSAGKGEVISTGSLGDVIEESIHVALGYVKAHAVKLGIKNDTFVKKDFHVHFPDGATPIDGPSAGVTFVTSLVSAILQRPCRAKCAMTGEVDLHGNVWPVGGIKEKLLAAQRSGIKDIFIPEGNRADVETLEDGLVGDIRIVFVSKVEHILDCVGLHAS